MIDQATVNRIIETAQIVEVVGDFVSLRRRGVNYIGSCPFHNEKTPSFTVSPAKGICKCFGCGKGGNSVNFIMELEQISYYEALKYLAKKYNIEIVEKEFTPEERAKQNDRESMFVINEFAQKYFSTTLHEHVDGQAIGMNYFKERGFNEDIIRKFSLGYCLETKDTFSQEAIKQGYKKDFLIKTGLAYETNEQQLRDRFRGRVMFPVHSLSGKVVAFGGRILQKNDKLAKYVNSPESEIYHKSYELYGIFQAKQSIVKHDRCFLVEGYTDVISMHQSGIENVVSSSGTSLTPGQIRLIRRFTPNITLIYDGDSAGKKAAERGADLLLEEGMNIKVVLLPDGEDPDSFAKKQNASDFIEYIEKYSDDFIRFKTKLLLKDVGDDPIKKANIISDIVKSISVITNNITRSVYIKECSNLMNIDEKVLYTEIKKIKSTQFQKNLQQQTRTNPSQDPPSIEISSTKEYEMEELHILRYIVRYAEKPLSANKDQNISVIDYVSMELEKDNLEMEKEIHRLLINEAKTQSKKDGFIAEKYFLNHSNPDVSRLALDLATEKYTLCQSQAEQLDDESSRLLDLVPRAIYELKNKIIINNIKEKIEQLKAAAENQNNEQMESLMQDISALNLMKSELAKKLGERIIIKL